MKTFLRTISFLAGAFLGIIGIYGLITESGGGNVSGIGVALFTLVLCVGFMYYALYRSPWEKAEKAAQRDAERQRREAGREARRAYAQAEAVRHEEERREQARRKQEAKAQKGPSFWERLEQRDREERDLRDRRKKAARAEGIPCCPTCGSTSISANRRGYKLGTGLFWGLLLGAAGFWLFAIFGALAGFFVGLTFGSVGSNSVRCTCLSCGRNFWPGQRMPW